MRAKPISFAQVIKSKGRPEPQLPQSQTLPRPSLSQLMDLFDNSPEEDYTLYLASLSKGKPNSFKAMASKTDRGEQMFDSWIQKQSFVSNKENQRLGTSRNKAELHREQKNITFYSKSRQDRQPLRSVADLVHKMELSQSNTPSCFKSNSRLRLDQSQGETQVIDHQKNQRQNQKTSLRQSNKYESNIQMPIKIPEKINAQPYIEQPTTVKPKRKEGIEELITQTQHIHEEIAQLAHQYMDEQDSRHEAREESLLIDSPQRKEVHKQEFTDNENEMRWQARKNTLDSYYNKLKLIQNQPTSSFAQQHRETPCEQPGYSFAVENIMPLYQIPLEIINIPQIQEIQSQRLPFENDQNYPPAHSQSSPHHNSGIPSTQSVKYELSPQKYNENKQVSGSPELQLSAKRVNSSLAFSSNPKDTPSPQDRERENNFSSGQQHVTLSFTQEKPQIVVNIPLDYAEVEGTDEFQMETVKVQLDCVEGPFVPSPSPDKDKYSSQQRKDELISIAESDNHEGSQNKDKFFRDGQDYRRDTIHTEEISKQIIVKRLDLEDKSKISNDLIVQAPQINIVLQPTTLDDDEVTVFPQKQSLSSLVAPSILQPSQDTQLPSIPVQLNQIGEETKKMIQQIEKQAVSIDRKPSEHILTSSPTQALPQTKKSNAKGSNSKGKGSPSVFGLKKIYSSPNSIPLVTAPPIVTSAFTPIDQKSSFEHNKGYAGVKVHEKQAKIESVAYSCTYAKRKEERKAMIEEEGQEFQFDF